MHMVRVRVRADNLVQPTRRSDDLGAGVHEHVVRVDEHELHSGRRGRALVHVPAQGEKTDVMGFRATRKSARRPPPWGVKQGRLRAVVDEPRGVKSLQAGGIHAVHEPARRVSQSCAPRRVARVVQRLTVRQEARAPRDVWVG